MEIHEPHGIWMGLGGRSVCVEPVRKGFPPSNVGWPECVRVPVAGGGHVWGIRKHFYSGSDTYPMTDCENGLNSSHLPVSRPSTMCLFSCLTSKKWASVLILWFGFGQSMSADMMRAGLWDNTFPFALPVLLFCLHQWKHAGTSLLEDKECEVSPNALITPAKSMSILITQHQLSPRRMSGSH